MNGQAPLNEQPRIYLINVGANSSHESRARSPLFINHDPQLRSNFHYVPFYCATSPKLSTKEYEACCQSFLNPRYKAAINKFAHVDPDWDNFTYGDCCNEPRAATLKNARVNDIFLFWGALYHNSGVGWEAFTGAKGWYLFGCLRVQHIVSVSSQLSSLDPQDRGRAQQNIHFRSGTELPHNDYVFLGDLSRSCAFTKAVDLQVNKDNGLMYEAFTTADGSALTRNGRPKWSDSLRSCRMVIDLGQPDHRSRAEILRGAIKKENGFDILTNGHTVLAVALGMPQRNRS
jgi:hypothetical protein